MISLKRQNQGFTIVELLIVIVVIGILAALVLNSFTGVQARARDTERRTDVNAIATQLEVFFNDNGSYPTATQLADDAAGGWVETNLKGFDKTALTDPKNVKINAAGGSYTYTTFPAGATSGTCDGAGGTTPCGNFTIVADMEKATDFTKKSLNN